MKITCQSCQSKYNVADEKVQGKIVKIRCRKCGATIVVNGAGEGAANGASAATNGTGAVDSWHVNVSDTDQRTMSVSEVVDAYNAGVITQDTFVWNEGMDDWKPLSEVEALVRALHASAGQMAVGTPGSFETPGMGSGSEEPMAAAAAPAYEPPAPEPVAEPKRAARSGARKGGDLFGAGGDVQTSAPDEPRAAPPPGGDGGLTGQRNESSVLFSLAVLTKSASDASESAGSGGKNTEDSGLIDLKALAAKSDVLGTGGSAGAEVFTAPIGLAPAPLTAPLGALTSTEPPKAKSNLPLIIGGAGAMVVLLVVGIVVGIKLAGPSPAPVSSAMPATTTSAPAPTDSSAAAAASSSADTAPSAAPSASVAAATTKPTGGYKPGAGAGTYHPPTGGAPKPGGAAAAGGGAPAPAPAPAPKKSGGDCGCNGDLMCLMKCSTH